MDASLKTEDDTIRDQMESGYVATRPRGTRARRTWSFNVRNLVAEDVRALDMFAMSNAYAARGGNAFLFPNLLPNWSFEFPALIASDVVAGWSIPTPVAQVSIAASSVAALDGLQALRFATVAGQVVAANATASAAVACDVAIPCKPGEAYAFTAQVVALPGTLAAGVLGANVAITFLAANGATLSTATGTAATVNSLWQPYGYQFTVPAQAASLRVALVTTLTNATSAAITLDASASVAWDCVGCALATPLTPYGRTVGSQPLGCLVRFSSLPEFADIGWGDGVKVYGCKAELQEV